MSLSYTVISIGALSRNRLWGENEPVRPSHATTTLIRDQDKLILVDPSLPPEVLKQRLDERAGLKPEQINTVFLTTFRPVHRRGLSLFEKAAWLMHEPEITAMHDHLAELGSRMKDESEADVRQVITAEQALLRRIRPADDKITASVHLFPTAGLSPGAAGLLLAIPSWTVVVAGDAVLTREYFEAGRIFEQAQSVEEAQESLVEIMEVADEIIPGHDNIFRVVGRR